MPGKKKGVRFTRWEKIPNSGSCHGLVSAIQVDFAGPMKDDLEFFSKSVGCLPEKNPHFLQ